jgi:hypothetical protein
VVETQKQAEEAEHQAAAEAAARADQTAPKGQAGKDYTDEQNERIINELLEDLGVQDDPQKAAEIRQQIKERR